MAKLISTFAEEAVKQALGDGAKFMLVELAQGNFKPVYDDRGELMKFANGGDAAKAAIKLSDKTGKKYQPRAVTDDSWRGREERRLAKGDYKPLPWEKERWWIDLKSIWNDHYPHAAISKGAHIAFTETPEKGAADIQTPMKPGRYLERFFGDVLGAHVIRDLCTAFAAKYEDNLLMFASDPDEMEEVYTNGPSSCMSKGTSAYRSKQHPVRVYAAGDLQVAYMKRNGRIVARAVVWPEKKVYNTPYGDHGRLTELLRKEGYRQEAPYGARLLRVAQPAEGKKDLYSFVVPHLDNVGWVRDDGEFLYIGGRDGLAEDGIQCSGAVGITEHVGYGCARCGGKKAMPQRSIKSVFVDHERTRNWCTKCAAEHAFTCAVSGYLVDKAQAIEVHPKKGSRKSEPMWGRYFKTQGFICAGDGKPHWLSDAVHLADGTVVSAQWFETNGGHTCKCGLKLRSKADCKGDECPRHKQQKAADDYAKSVYRTGTVNVTMTVGSGTPTF